MARKQEVIVHLVDDLDGTTAAETVSFAVDGIAFEIDLSKKNAKALRSDFEKWTASARRARAKTRATRRRPASRPVSDAAAIRNWATEQGIAVPARGRLPKSVVEQYQAS